MSNEQNELFKKGFTFTQISKEEFDVLEAQAKKEYRTLTSLLTIHIKKLVQKLKEQQQQSI